MNDRRKLITDEQFKEMVLNTIKKKSYIITQELFELSWVSTTEISEDHPLEVTLKLGKPFLCSYNSLHLSECTSTDPKDYYIDFDTLDHKYDVQMSHYSDSSSDLFDSSNASCSSYEDY